LQGYCCGFNEQRGSRGLSIVLRAGALQLLHPRAFLIQQLAIVYSIWFFHHSAVIDFVDGLALFDR
jgi:hypothetical protein